MVFAGTDGCTSITLGMRMMPATGAKSRTKSKLSLSQSDVLIGKAAVAPAAHLLLCKSPRNPADPCERTLEIVERGAGEAGSAQFDIADQ